MRRRSIISLLKPFKIWTMVCVEMLYNNDDDVYLHVYDLS